MSDSRSIQRRTEVPLAHVGKPSRLLERGFARLDDQTSSLAPVSARWTLQPLWDPSWLKIVHTQLSEKATLSEVKCVAHSIGNNSHVAGNISVKDWPEGPSCEFEWDLATSSRSVQSSEDKRGMSYEHASSWASQDVHLSYREWADSRELFEFDTRIKGVSVGAVYVEKPIRNVKLGKTAACVVEDGVITRLSSLGGYNDLATAINAARDIVGYSHTSDETMKAVRWRGSQILELPNRFIDSEASHINDAGLIIGWGDNIPQGELVSENRRGLVWKGDELIAVLPGVPAALNEAGQVVGTEQSGKKERGFVWWDGTTTFLPLSEPFKGSGVAAINEHGDVAGWVKTKTGHRDRFLAEVACVWLRIP